MKLKVKATVVEIGDVEGNEGKPGALIRLVVHPAHLRELAKLLYREVGAEIVFEVKP